MSLLVQLLAFVCILGATAGAVIFGLRFVRHYCSIEFLRSNHELGGVFFAVLGTAYGVLLSFFIVAGLSRYQAAVTTGVQEAADLGSLFWLAQTLPDADRRQVQGDVADYARVVVSTEWPLMAKNQESDAAWTLSDRLWQSVLRVQPATDDQRIVYTQLLAQRQRLDRDRRLRLLSAHHQIPNILWIVLGIGGVVTILFTYSFGMERFWVQALMTGALAGMIVLVLLLVYELDNPYQGVALVRPDGFQSIVDLTNNPPSP